MAVMARQSFDLGWTPNADSVNAPPNCLLRGDNLILDELGVVAVRPGSAKVNSSPFADTDIHSLFTVVINGVRYRLSGAGAKVYSNGAALSPTLAGSGDTAFGSFLGQAYFARSTSKFKFDGTTVRNWGIAMTGGAPTVSTATAVQPGGEILSGNSTESPAVVYTEDDGTGPTFADGFDAAANGAIVLHPKASTLRGILDKTFAAPTDFSTFDDDSFLNLYFYVTDPTKIQSVGVAIDVNDGTYVTDAYMHSWFNNSGSGIPDDFPAVGWNRLSIRKGSIYRLGSTTGKDWSTVKAVRVSVLANASGASATVRVDALGLSVGAPGATSPVPAQWRYVYIRNDGNGFGKSGPSAPSAEATFDSAGVTVTVPADASRDTQVNEIWLFRLDDNLGDYYRVATKAVSGTGTVTILDAVPAESALTINIKLEQDNTGPPDNIIGITGPYYDRLFVLTTTHLYPSRRLAPDSFSTGQAIRVASGDETALWVQKGLGGLYIGTTRDIYWLDGTGAELPDGTIEFTKRPLNIDNPPRSARAVAQEGNLLVYLAADGWRSMMGAGSQLITGGTSLLYQGKTRHGVSPVNLVGGRLRAAIAKGQLAAITPEGASSTASNVLYRFMFNEQRWYRFTYGAQAWRAIHREEDGTLIASDSAGFVWILDTGVQDDTADIPIVMWTKVDDDGKPLQRKDPWDLRIRANTGGALVAAAVHVDGASVSSDATSVQQTGMGVTLSNISSIATCRQLQLRVTGSVSSFQWFDHAIGYREHPQLQVFTDLKPDTPSPSRRRFGGTKLTIDTLGGTATVALVVDGVTVATQSVITTNPQGVTITFSSQIGRDCWARITEATGFELYQAEPLVLEEIPGVFKGVTSRQDSGYPGIKTLSGIQVKACTMGAAVTVQTILDGAASDSFIIQSGTAEPILQTLAFSIPRQAAQVALHFGGDVELYSWDPLITAKRPLGIKAWDSGPMDLGAGEVIWPREVWLKVEAGADLTIIPHFDGYRYPAVVAAIPSSDLGLAVKVRVPIPRGFKGRVPRFQIRSSQPFFPYWVEFVHRQTREAKEKEPTRVAAKVGGETAA